MGAKTNHPFKVVATKGNKAVIGTGKTPEDLAVGQLGVFDAYTNLSVDATAIPKHFYFLLAVDRDGDGVVDDYVKSAGQLIEKNLVNSVAYSNYRAHQPAIMEISDFIAKCETEYSLTIKPWNAETLTRLGYLPYIKTYHVTTDCCAECGVCGQNYCASLAKSIVDAINNDEDDLFYAEGVQTINTAGAGGTPVYEDKVITDWDAYFASVAAVNMDDDTTNDTCPKIRITSKPNAVRSFCALPSSPAKAVGTRLEIHLNMGFECTGKVTEVQKMIIEEGGGLQLKHREYHSLGTTEGSPYRQSAIHGLPINEHQYIIDETAKYNQIAISYERLVYSGWGEYLDPMTTIFAVPKDDSTTYNSLKSYIDKLV